MEEGVATPPSLLKAAGYLTGNIHNEYHRQPEISFTWDYVNETLRLTEPDGVVGRCLKGMAEE